MTKEEKEEIKKIIELQINSLQTEIHNIQNKLKPIKKDCSLDNIDHKILKQDQDIAIKRFEIAKKRLNSLQACYSQVDSEVYGICQECEEEIDIQRLKLIPQSQYCVACLNELEK